MKENYMNLWGWGQLGSEFVSPNPLKLQTPPEVLGVHLGSSEFLAWTSTQAFIWDDSLLDAPGPVDSITHPTLIKTTSYSTLVAFGNRKLREFSEDSYQELKFPSHVQLVECGATHSLVLDSDGKVYAWGNYENGRLGVGNASEPLKVPTPITLFDQIKIVQLACGQAHSLALDVKGEVYSWGNGTKGQLGHGDTNDCWEPQLVHNLGTKFVSKVACGSEYSVVVTNLGEVLNFGSNEWGQLGMRGVSELCDPAICYSVACLKVIDVSCGSGHSLLIHEDGSVYALGRGLEGQLGNGEKESSHKPVLVPFAFEGIRKVLCGAYCSAVLCKDMRQLSVIEEESTVSAELFEHFSESVEYNYRPSNLPLKDPEEAAWQQSLVAAQDRMYLDRVREQEKVAKKQKEAQLQKEAKIRELMQKWESQVLNNWEQKKKSKMVQQLVVQGIPPKFRGEVWFRLAGNPLSVTQEYLEINFAKAQKLRDRLEAGESGADGKENSLKLIQLDVERTFNHLGYFKNGSPLQQQLTDLLEAFIISRPDIGYIQGMSYIGGTLVLYLDIYRTFVLFVSIVSSPVLFPFYRVDFDAIGSRFQVFRLLFHYNMPQLCEHFESEGVRPQMFLFEWFTTMYSKSLSQEVVVRIWDLYFYYGPVILYRVGLAILKLLYNSLLNEDILGIMACFQHLGEHITDPDMLVDQAQQIKVPNWIIDEISGLTYNNPPS